MTSCSIFSRSYVLLPLLVMMIWSVYLTAQAQPDTATPAADTQLQDTLSTLNSLLELQSQMKADMISLGEQLSAARTEAEKKDIQAQLDKVSADLKTTNRNLREIAAGADIDSLRSAEETS